MFSIDYIKINNNKTIHRIGHRRIYPGHFIDKEEEEEEVGQKNL